MITRDEIEAYKAFYNREKTLVEKCFLYTIYGALIYSVAITEIKLVNFTIQVLNLN